MQFTEQEVNAQHYQGTSFKEVSIHLVRGATDPSQEDWFDHKKYIREILPRLKSIRPPAQVRCRREQERKPIKVDEDIVMYDPVKENSEKPRLVPLAKPKFVKYKIELSDLKFNDRFIIEPKNLLHDDIAERVKTHLSSVTLPSASEDKLLSQTFDFFSKNQTRKQLQDTLSRPGTSRADFWWLYKDLNQDGTFKRRSSFKFAQLNASLPFIAESHAQDYFYCMLVDDTKAQLEPVLEYILQHLLVDKGFGADFPQVYVLPLKEQGKMIWEASNEALKAVKDFDPESIINDVRDKQSVKLEGLLSVPEMNKIAESIMQDTDFGLMLYYGSSQLNTADSFKETSYYKQLMQHLILGFKTVQHKGNLVFKLYETYSNFTASLLFILYRLFDSVLLGKPLASSPLTSTQYIVCQGFKKCPADLLSQLETLYSAMPNEATQLFNFTLIDPYILENEERFRSYIQKVNDISANYRHQVIAGSALNEEPSDEVKLANLAQAFDRWHIPRSKRLEDVKVENDAEAQPAMLQGANMSRTQNNGRQTTRYSAIGGTRQSEQILEPLQPKLSDEAMLIQIREKDKEVGSFLADLQAKSAPQQQKRTAKPNLTENDKRIRLLQEKEQQRLDAIKRLQDDQERRNAKKAPAAKRKPKDSAEEEEKGEQPAAEVTGDKIKIPYGKQRPRDEKRDEKLMQSHKISIAIPSEFKKPLEVPEASNKRLRRLADTGDEVIGKRSSPATIQPTPIPEKRIEKQESEKEKVLTKEEIERKIAENKKKQEEEAGQKAPVDATRLALLKKYAANPKKKD